MGKFTALVLFLLSVTVFSCTNGDEERGNAGKSPPPPGRMVTGENLFAVEAVGPGSVWIVGFEGVVLHTADGGTNWEFHTPPVKTDYYDACFITQDRGWVVGKFGTILYTENGGKTWSLQQSGTKERLFDAHFIDENTGWVVGTMGTIIHTADGGKTWLEQGWGEDRYYNSVFFVDARRGWIAGEYSTIYHTEDGGVHWAFQECVEIEPEEPPDDFPPPPPNLYGVFFKSADIGWITGMDGIIIGTEDGGITWKRLTSKTDFSLYQIKVGGERGWAVGEKGSYLVTADGGKTWQLQEESLKTKFWLRGMAFANAQHGWIVGACGAIIKTVDSGKSWQGISGVFLE